MTNVREPDRSRSLSEDLNFDDDPMFPDDYDAELLIAPEALRSASRSPHREIGRVLRVCAGVDEELVLRVWPDRHRYVGLGGIVLATAIASAVSLTLAIALMSGGLRWYYLIVPIVWGLLVFNLDRWLISSTHGVGRPWKLLPRLMIAVVFGFVMAEPIILWVFNDAIEERILDDRASEVQDATTRLTLCNPAQDPVAGAERAADPNCEGAIVDRPILPLPEVSTSSAEADLLRSEVSRSDMKLEALESELSDVRDRYQREIGGVAGSDASGVQGRGPIAEALAVEVRAIAAEIETVRAGQDEQFERLVELDARADRELSSLAADQRAALEDYSEATSAAISAAIGEIEARNEAPIGLLQRMDALALLSGENTHIFVARWLLTIILIVVDSMPVIAKAVGGVSSYDRVHSRSLAASERRAQYVEKFVELERVRRIELIKYRRELERSSERKQLVQDNVTVGADLSGISEDQVRQDGDYPERDDSSRGSDGLAIIDETVADVDPQPIGRADGGGKTRLATRESVLSTLRADGTHVEVKSDDWLARFRNSLG